MFTGTSAKNLTGQNRWRGPILKSLKESNKALHAFRGLERTVIKKAVATSDGRQREKYRSLSFFINLRFVARRNKHPRDGDKGRIRLLRFCLTPEIEVHLVKSDEAIGGIGEPGVPPTAPAVVNAVFNATGARVRRIPLTPQRVLEAIKTRSV